MNTRAGTRVIAIRFTTAVIVHLVLVLTAAIKRSIIQFYKEHVMAYVVIDNMRTAYGPRKGLEGPFNFSGRVLYYDVKEGSYYDPRTDFYVDQSEMAMLHNELMRLLDRAGTQTV
jgi:hypothetical protein